MLGQVGAVGYALDSILGCSERLMADVSGLEMRWLNLQKHLSLTPGVVAPPQELQLCPPSEKRECGKKDVLEVVHGGRPLHIRSSLHMQGSSSLCMQQSRQEALHQQCHASRRPYLHPAADTPDLLGAE